MVPLHIPPLRKRKEEIPFLVEAFLNRYAAGRNIEIDAAVFEAFQNYDWPGNIRELENVLERAVVLTAGDRLQPEILPPAMVQSRSKNAKPQTLEEAERSAIRHALSRSGGNQTRAARLLEIPRHVLLYRMKKLNISSKNRSSS